MLTLLANIAGILGLFASVAAWISASSAKDAARQARQAVRLADAVEKLNSLGVKATELLALVEGDYAVAATLRGRDLTSDLVRARLRWERFLSAESKTALWNQESWRHSRPWQAVQPNSSFSEWRN